MERRRGGKQKGRRRSPRADAGVRKGANWVNDTRYKSPRQSSVYKNELATWTLLKATIPRSSPVPTPRHSLRVHCFLGPVHFLPQFPFHPHIYRHITEECSVLLTCFFSRLFTGGRTLFSRPTPSMDGCGFCFLHLSGVCRHRYKDNESHLSPACPSSSPTLSPTFKNLSDKKKDEGGT